MTIGRRQPSLRALSRVALALTGALALASALVPAAGAQPRTGSTERQFSTGEELVQLDFRDVELAVVVETIAKISEGRRPNVLDMIQNREVALIINTPTRKGGDTDEGRIRAAAVTSRTPLIGTLTGAQAAVQAIAALRAGTWTVHALQDHFPSLEGSEEPEVSATS